MSIARAHKGSAFRKPADEPVQPVTKADETPLSDTQSAGEPPTTVLKGIHSKPVVAREVLSNWYATGQAKQKAL